MIEIDGRKDLEVELDEIVSAQIWYRKHHKLNQIVGEWDGIKE